MRHRTAAPAAVLAVAIAATGCEAPLPADRAAPAPEPPPSEAALRLARFKEREERRSCLVFRAGADVAVEDFTFRFARPQLVAPETRLPWIGDPAERTALGRRNTRALVVPYAVKNSAPITRVLPFECVLVTRDGASHLGWRDNALLWTTAHGRTAAPSRLAPGVWVESAYVFDIEPALVDGAVLYLTWVDHERATDGSRRAVMRQHAVVDLAATETGPPIRGG